MAKGSIKAQLISTSYCQAHWIIAFSQSGECINADLSVNTLQYTQNHPIATVLDSIEFDVKNDCPSIDKMK